MTSCSDCGGQCLSPHDNTPTAQQLSEVERSLDPCPFCGGEPYFDSVEDAEQVVCDKCGGRGPQREDIWKAADAWNIRKLRPIRISWVGNWVGNLK
jgi:Lar family restriction alleviation protein